MIKRTKKVAPAALETPVVETPVVETPVVETATAETPAKPAKIRYAKRDWAATDVITVNTPNPKKGKSYHRYALYANGMTVAEYAKALADAGLGGKTLANADLRWDMARNFISISPKAQ
jgi:hypothetical protein